ncbi:MAG: hypothetical protein EXX96DRAFT_586905 [Benjaminiella poitrasii]|nr:MAG: hypothetical protein EXX96DRAFT_586905 [Benjaminiella poitrasii]
MDLHSTVFSCCCFCCLFYTVRCRTNFVLDLCPALFNKIRLNYKFIYLFCCPIQCLRGSNQVYFHSKICCCTVEFLSLKHCVGQQSK